MEASFSSMYSNITTVDPVTIMEERAISSDNSGDNSPSCTNFPTSTSSPKRRRAIQKKIMNIPIKDLDGSKFKSDCTPPSDSWAWRKYGQKPIKGSPYPRGYYRCSSSKGCPARKQVERSRSDPTMLVVTYSYDHNHPWPTSRNHHHQSRTTTTTTAATSTTLVEVKPTSTTKTITLNNNNQITQFPQNNINGHNNSIISPSMDHLHQPLIPPTDELPWVTSDQEILQNDFIFSNNYNFNDLDMAKFFPMREEDESLFADLGELPECPVVFHRAAGDEPVNLTPWCGSTG